MNKVELAVQTYDKYKDLEETMPYRKFRTVVVEQMKKDLKIPEAAYGTIGDYYCQARNRITKRKKHFYHRLESTINKTPEQRKQERIQQSTIAEAFASW